MDANCTLPRSWEEAFKNDRNSNKLIIQDHYLIKMHQIKSLIKLESWETYMMHVSSFHLKPTSPKHSEKLFQKFDFDWTKIYLLPRVVTVDSRLRIFQYKLLNTNYKTQIPWYSMFKQTIVQISKS